MLQMRRWIALLLAVAGLAPHVGAAPKRYVALTFDDGPCRSSTAFLLKGLAERGVHATFFLSGYRIDENPGAARAIARQGHELAIHGQTHRSFRGLPEAARRCEIACNAERIRNVTGVEPTLVRPPGGWLDDRTKALCRESGYALVLWSVDPRDWDTARRNGVADHVVQAVTGGDIILLHDVSKLNAEQAFLIIDRLQAQGYSFCTVSELAAQYGTALIAGETYRRFR